MPVDVQSLGADWLVASSAFRSIEFCLLPLRMVRKLTRIFD